jgi:hypothetical protein
VNHDRDTGSLLDTLKRRNMTRLFIDADHQPGAAEMERGEAAQLILRDAQSRAQMLPRDEFERRWRRSRSGSAAG